MSGSIEVIEIDDKHSAGWPTELLYSDFNVMIILSFTYSIVESIERSKKCKKKFNNIFGKDNWKYYDNYDEHLNDVVFLRDMDNLFQNMLIDINDVRDLVKEIRIFKENRNDLEL